MIFASQEMGAGLQSVMDFRSVRSELLKLGNKRLYKLLMSQKESKCLLNGLCSLLFKYKGYTFCLSEVLGRGCEIENLKKLENETCQGEEGPPPEEEPNVSLFDCIGRASTHLMRGEGIHRLRK